jgi:hypothetical protein
MVGSMPGGSSRKAKWKVPGADAAAGYSAGAVVGSACAEDGWAGPSTAVGGAAQPATKISTIAQATTYSIDFFIGRSP